jgi:prolyl oligopeptidase PreP (S9A serine peptidase family)
VEIVLDKIKEWKEWKEWYYRDFWKNLKKSNSEYKKIFIKISRTKSLEEREKIINVEFKDNEIEQKSKASYLFLHLWLIIGIKEDNNKVYINWGKIKRPSIKKMKKLMIKNNCKEIELKAVGFMNGYFKPIVKIRN